MSDDTGIQVAAIDEATTLGGRRLWRRIDPATLRTNLGELIDQVHGVLPGDRDADGAGFRISQVQVAVAVGAKGQVGLLGTGGEANIQASFTITLERR